MSEIFWNLVNITILIASTISLAIGQIILLSLFKMKKLYQLDRLVMLIVTCMDIIWSIYQIVISSCKLRFGPEFIYSMGVSCQLYVLFNTGCLRLSNGCVAILAVIRYMVGCRNKSLKNWIWPLIITIHICICLTFSLTTFIRWDARRTSSGLICLLFLSEGDLSKYLMIAHTSYYLIQCATVTIFYFLICKHWYYHLNNLKMSAKLNEDLESIKHINFQQKKIVFQGLLVVLADCITFIPSTVTYVMKLGFGYVRPPLVDGVVVWMLTTLPIVNPVITLWLQPEVNAEFWTYYSLLSDKVKNFFRTILA
ncbi:hypothetical protein CONCODRAFT_5394 [Conidiobolus coronatus NRRL 28638]|uniref:G-protein coupled receptors family 1 profile domain-containing protein n=1 Tax=Conidiobolus coronatus (strain ATCC 28846 / CBS 209.66 / NRRL 28638) TaxID=796925 RepID=A0A137PA35_CONC2|nr:hypothetical protein CONCODRAFT_5394 [Conidiobolus coronatus NRRL 28638]|eukprot:KXN71869.1 hypothetical protein CONCODRAFT_5394 [Conidiobolus coronatus NRRL 28638]